MSSTYSSNLRIELIGSGDQAGAWGATTDSNLAYIMDTAIAGYQAVPITSTSQALTYVNWPSSTANLNQAVYAMLKFTGATAATSVYIPPASKQYIVYNNSGYTITIYNSTVIGNTTAAGSGIAVVNGDKIMIWSDGTNVFDLQAQNLTGTLAISKDGADVETISFNPGSVSDLIKKNCVPHQATFITRDLFLESGGFDVDMKQAMDYDLWLRLAHLYKEHLHVLPFVVAKFDSSGESTKLFPLLKGNAMARTKMVRQYGVRTTRFTELLFFSRIIAYWMYYRASMFLKRGF
jgi:hypothetical protein